MDEESSVIPYDSIRLIKKYLHKQQGLSVVDLGCAKGYFLFGLFDDPDLSFHLMEGIDLWEEEDKTPKNFDLNSEYNSDAECRQEGKSQFISNRKDIKTFICLTSNSYDLIILSKILHFYPHDQIINILKQCQSLLTTDGIIYVKMANEKHPYSDQKDKTVFSEKFKSELKQDFEIIHLNNSDIHAEFIIK
ncbi:MAG: class I SAM-dependent methyltransferase [Saprospiraceae bacterium]|nr:class I SAM-dependent methyltransferase [Saprospiraceae bacterium]